MEKARYINPTKTRGKKKKKEASQAFIFVFDAKTYQPAADASNERYNSRVQPIHSFLAKNSIQLCYL